MREAPALALAALLSAAGVTAFQAAAEPGGESAGIFAAGNDHYASGDFEEAARHYRQLLSQGYQSEAVHYNLGNALFKLNQLGPAILEYEKAAALAPNDPDVQANLEYLRTLTADRTSEGSAQTTTFFVERLLALTTTDQDAAAFTIFYLAISALASFWIISSSQSLRRAAVWGVAILALPLALAATSLGVKLYRDSTVTQAILLEERVDVRSGPGEENTILFTVHEGLKVRIRNQQGSWWQVSLENGLNGWVPASSLGVI